MIKNTPSRRLRGCGSLILRRPPRSARGSKSLGQEHRLSFGRITACRGSDSRFEIESEVARRVNDPHTPGLRGLGGLRSGGRHLSSAPRVQAKQWARPSKGWRLRALWQSPQRPPSPAGPSRRRISPRQNILKNPKGLLVTGRNLKIIGDYGQLIGFGLMGHGISAWRRAREKRERLPIRNRQSAAHVFPHRAERRKGESV